MTSGVQILGEHGLFVGAEDAAVIALQLDVVLAEVCRPRSGVPRPRPPRALAELRDACRAVAAAAVARTHADLARRAAATAVLASMRSDDPNSPSMITVREAAARSGRSPSFWRSSAACGRVLAIKAGPLWLVDATDVDRLAS